MITKLCIPRQPYAFIHTLNITGNIFHNRQIGTELTSSKQIVDQSKSQIGISQLRCIFNSANGKPEKNLSNQNGKEASISET